MGQRTRWRGGKAMKVHVGRRLAHEEPEGWCAPAKVLPTPRACWWRVMSGDRGVLWIKTPFSEELKTLLLGQLPEGSRWYSRKVGAWRITGDVLLHRTAYRIARSIFPDLSKVSAQR